MIFELVDKPTKLKINEIILLTFLETIVLNPTGINFYFHSNFNPKRIFEIISVLKLKSY